MATYKVQSNGKAPKGLKNGDTVVTGGGTYKITGTNSDGSYKSTKINNTTTSNYKGTYATLPSSSGGSSRGGSSGGSKGGSSGGGSSKTYSQYTGTTNQGTAVNKSYDPNTDYQALIDQAVANKDYVSAARYEQQRNEKIRDLDASGTNKYGASTTNLYSGWLIDTDYSDVGRRQMAAGVDADTILNTINNRYNKADGTVGLDQYKNDAFQQAMWDYYNKMLEEPEEYEASDYGGFSYSSPRPTYTDQYDAKIDELLDKILTRDKFSYDIEDDPLYKQYSEMYAREGDRAMRETMAEAAAGAGGMNSYAIAAAQQANNYYASQMGDKIPVLYQLAYDMYLDGIDADMQNMGLLQQMSNNQYSRYRDTMSDWRDDRNFAYNMAQDEYNKWLDERNFNYQVSRDQVSDSQWNESFEYNAGRDQVSDSQWDKAFNQEAQNEAYSRVVSIIKNGGTPTLDQITAAGLTQKTVDEMIEWYKMNLTASNGSSGGKGGSQKTVDDNDDDFNDDDLIISEEKDKMIEEVMELFENGEISEAAAKNRIDRIKAGLNPTVR